MSILNQALAETISGEKWASGRALEVMRAIIGSETDDAIVTGGLLSALQARGPYEELLCAAVEALQEKCRPAPVPNDNLVDCCGTGGDVKFSFNISTAAGLIAASAGAKVSKHGNRSVSSRCGSADVLASVGVDLDRCAQVYERAVAELGFGFLYAPYHHHILARVAPVRRALGVPTLFNLIGPLLNPSGAPYQLLGTYTRANQEVLAGSLRQLDRRKAWVVRADDGMDELSVFCANEVIEVTGAQTREFVVDPQQYDLACAKEHAEQITVSDPASASGKLWESLSQADSVCGRIARLNAAAVLCLSGVCADLEEALGRARQAQEDGHSEAVLKAYIALFS